MAVLVFRLNVTLQKANLKVSRALKRCLRQKDDHWRILIRHGTALPKQTLTVGIIRGRPSWETSSLIH